jgi:hypothetical protein
MIALVLQHAWVLGPPYPGWSRDFSWSGGLFVRISPIHHTRAGLDAEICLGGRPIFLSYSPRAFSLWE